jgi:type IV/VI secretion system ImpK/VasF family protein
MSTSELGIYHQRAQFCQPYVEFMTQVVTLLGARKLSPSALRAQLRRQIERVKAYSLEARQAPVAVDEAIFAVCAWADEQIMNAQWEGVSEGWSQTLLQMDYFKTNLAGELFFERLDNLSDEALPAQSVYALCLANGFKGKYVFNLSVQELELRRQEAMNNALIEVGLIHPEAQTFPSITELSSQPAEPVRDWRRYLPVGVSLIFLVLLAIILNSLLQLNIALVLARWL